MFGFLRKNKGSSPSDSGASPQAPSTTTGGSDESASSASASQPRRRRRPRNSQAGDRPSTNQQRPRSDEQRSSRPPQREPAKRAPERRPSVGVKPEGVFAELIEPLRHALYDSGYGLPTPIQSQSIPHLIEGRDLLGCAQTGTGKTAAFVLPLLQDFVQRHQTRPHAGRPRALIIAPTRELAAQIGDSITTYGHYVNVNHTVIFGGVKQHSQVQALTNGIDILVATPGRLLDLMQQGLLMLEDVEVFVLDEADRMLDMGFIHDIRKVIAALPEKRQSLFFSATMAGKVTSLAKTLVRNPVQVSIAPEKPTLECIVQKLMFVDKGDKNDLLTDLLSDSDLDRVIVFTRTKHMANRVAQKLDKANISAVAIHGNKSQNARTQALASFKSGKTRVMVATDIAARGIDVDAISHVINYDLPNEEETYVHRIGRTARAGAEGDAISFCAADERDYLRGIERLLRKAIPVDQDHPYHSETARNATGAAARPAPKVQRQRGGGGRGGGRGGRGRY